MNQDLETLKQMYDGFNARDIDRVLAALADDVVWANGMDGGHVHGAVAVRAYWTAQWAMVSPHVKPLRFDRTAEGLLVVKVEQSVRDLQGRPLEDEAFGLQDKIVGHVFRFDNGKVTRFDIQDHVEQAAPMRGAQK